MASRWEVLAMANNDITATDEYGYLAQLEEVLRLCHMFDDGGGEYGPGIEAHVLADAIYTELSQFCVKPGWDEAGTGWRDHNRRVDAFEATRAADAEPSTAVDMDTPEDELPPLREGAR